MTQVKEKKETNGKAPVAPVAPKVVAQYRAGRIAPEEAGKLHDIFKGLLLKGASQLEALKEMARLGNRRPEIIAGNQHCSWAHGLIPLKEKKAAAPRAPKAPPEVAPELKMVLAQMSQFGPIMDHLKALSEVLVAMRDHLATVTEPSVLDYARRGAGTLVAMQANWLPRIELPQV